VPAARPPHVTDFPSLIRILADSGVRFIIVGGAAATAHGATRLTQDLDIVYQRSTENIERLVSALAPHSPYLRGAPPGLPFVFDRPTVEAGLNFTLTTDLGDLDLFGEIAGGGDYAALRDHCIELELFGTRCLCVDLKKLIDVKRAAGRPKDFEALAELIAIRRERGEED
jgi:predicted nucleotidyltransferase